MPIRICKHGSIRVLTESNRTSVLMGIGEVQVKDEDATLVEVKNRVREILQVNELVLIREYLIKRASTTTANKAMQRTAAQPR